VNHFASTHQVTQALGLDARDGDRAQLASDQQPHQPLGIAPIGVTRSDGPRTINPAAHTKQSTPAASNRRVSANPVGPASYVAQTGPGIAATNPQTTLLRPDNRSHLSSSESRSMIAATVPLTCTSNATNS
jgi:hypothetical protein